MQKTLATTSNKEYGVNLSLVIISQSTSGPYLVHFLTEPKVRIRLPNVKDVEKNLGLDTSNNKERRKMVSTETAPVKDGEEDHPSRLAATLRVRVERELKLGATLFDDPKR